MFNTRLLFFVAIIFKCISYCAQEAIPVRFQGDVSDEKGSLPSAQVQISRNGKVENTILTDGSGKYAFALPLGGEFLVSVTKEGYITKKFTVNTGGVPPEKATIQFPIIQASLSLFKKMEGVDYSALDQPLNKYKYNPLLDNFEYDAGYLNQMITKIGTIKEAEKEVVRKEKEKESNYETAIKQGDKSFEAKDWESALASYKEAQKLKPKEVYPGTQITNVNRLIVQDAAKKAADEAAAKTKADLEAKKAADLAAAKAKADADANAKLKAEADAAKARAAADAQAKKLAADEAAKKAAEAAALKAKADADALAKKQAEEGDAKARAEKEKADKLAREKAEADAKKQAADEIAKRAADAAALKAKAEADALAKKQADEADAKARLEKEKADRLAREKAEADARAKTEAELLAKKQADAAAAKARSEQEAAERLKAEKAKAEADALAKKAADEAAAKKAAADAAAKAIADKEAAEKLAKDKAAADAIAKKQAELDALEKKKADEENKKLQEQDAKYRAILTKGDDAFNKNDFVTAKSAFTEASGLRPDDSYPKNRLIEVGYGLKFSETLKQADDLFSANKYKDAKKKYEEALTYKGGDTYAKGKLVDCEKQLNSDSNQTTDERVKQLLAKYGPGVTEETITGPNAVIIQRVVVRDNMAWVFQKKIFNWGGTACFRDGATITEGTFEAETKP